MGVGNEALRRVARGSAGSAPLHTLDRARLPGGGAGFFCAFTIDRAYGWAEECVRRFGSHPVQIIADVNSAQHVADVESVPAKRPFTRRDLQYSFDYADEQLALLVQLYAQPLTRIQQLTVDDIDTTPDGVLVIRLGDPPTPVTAPFDDIIRQHLAMRRNQTTATSMSSPWLFPGRASGTPLHTTSLRGSASSTPPTSSTATARSVNCSVRTHRSSSQA